MSSPGYDVRYSACTDTGIALRATYKVVRIDLKRSERSDPRSGEEQIWISCRIGVSEIPTSRISGPQILSSLHGLHSNDPLVYRRRLVYLFVVRFMEI